MKKTKKTIVGYTVVTLDEKRKEDRRWLGLYSNPWGCVAYSHEAGVWKTKADAKKAIARMEKQNGHPITHKIFRLVK